MTSSRQLPKFEQDLFKLEQWDYYLIPTAEVPLTNIHQNEILDEEALPLNYPPTPVLPVGGGLLRQGHRGLIRQHQFNKVELVKFCRPEDSYTELETCWRRRSPSWSGWRSPTAWCFSARETWDSPPPKPMTSRCGCPPREPIGKSPPAAIRRFPGPPRKHPFRRKGKKGKKGTELVHTLNGSGLAVGRTFAAILENFQRADGAVVIPEALRPYMGGLDILTP